MSIIDDIIKQNGIECQTDIAIEELAELIQALLKARRHTNSPKAKQDLLFEMADVKIMLDQLEIMYGSCRREVDLKLKRLESYIGDDRR